MSAIGYADVQDSARVTLASLTEQSAGTNVLPPFSGKLSVDDKLKLRNANFKQTIDDFFKDKNITPLSQLTTTPPFPTPHVLAQFASKAYRDYEKRETDAQYETRIALPDGWKLLTTASNSSKINGYFGAAYWQPEHQQVVIAHRGTDPTNLGALLTDLKGVLRNQYVRQMDSASTFAHKVVEVLREVTGKYGVSFQLFFTGHILGGWLAQITTFTTKYLNIEGNVFLKSDNNPQGFHPHAVVFGSPGCKMMLSQMKDTFDVRHVGRSIALKHLDITTYLSAPNRINTCHKHLGTIYRIFPDLSDMGWLAKLTAFYNVITNSLDKIVHVFDPETGLVYKDERGILKIQVVADWPVTDGFQRHKEYEGFFKWAEHLNNYHPCITDITLSHKGYNPIRYQTKTYDERVSRLSVFSQEECQFLQDYLRLRQLPELFNPKELFSVMEDNQAQENAEKILQGFEIENDTIRCADISALQALIPYVKRLLQLFPEINESTTSALSSDEVRKRVYQIETRRYIERISQSPLDFKADDLSLRDFVGSDYEQVLHLQMVDGDEWTGIIKIYQVLQKTGCLSEGQYTLLKLERLISVNQWMDFSTLMQSTGTPHLLLMACDTNQLLNDEAQHIIRKFFSTIKEKPYIKIFLSTRSEGITPPCLQQIGREIFGKAFVRRDEQLTWSDLTTSSQEKLLEKSVKFQGAKISLNELMSAETPAATFLHLGALLEEKELKIADPVPISNVCNEINYIGRTLHRLRAIKQEIFSDKNVTEKHVYLASTEQEFKRLCQLYPNRNVHWLEMDKSGNLVWQESQGSLEIVRRYIETESSQSYTADDLDKLLEQAEHQRVMLISDTAGMGKSTVLTHLSKQIKQKFPTKWVVSIDLNDHTDALKELKQRHIDKEKAIEFLSQTLLKLEPGLELELFKQCCEQKQKVRLVIMLDSFDKISPFYKQTVIDLLQVLRQTAVEQLWVTTRPHLRTELEDKLQQLSYTMEPFSEEDQVEFLKENWCLKHWFIETDDKREEKEKSKLEIFAENLIKDLSYSISDIDKVFTGIPLHTHVLAEAFDKQVKKFYQSAESMPELQMKLELLGLYERFIERKYDIYMEENLQVSLNNVAAIALREYHVKTLREDHQLLALKVLLTEEQVTQLEPKRRCSYSDEELSRIGIVQLSHEGKLHFVHISFAEYLVADYLVNRLTEGNNTSEQVLASIMEDIFLRRENRVIRLFVDGLISRSEQSEEVLKQYGNGLHNLGKDCELILHQSVHEGNANIIGFLLDSLQAGGHTDEVSVLLLTRDKYRRNAWQKAALGGNLQILEKLWKCANENLTREVIRNNLLLATDSKGSTVWHVAAESGNLVVLNKVWDWAKESLTTEEINNKLLLATDDKGRTVWHLAVEGGNLEALLKIWEWAKNALTREEIKYKLLLATDNKGRTVWHVAAENGSLEALNEVWDWAKEILTTEEINNKLLLATDDTGRTVWHLAVEGGNLEALLKMWEWAKDALTREEIKYKLLLATDNKGRNIWEVAADQDKLSQLQQMWDWAKGNLTQEEMLSFGW